MTPAVPYSHQTEAQFFPRALPRQGGTLLPVVLLGGSGPGRDTTGESRGPRVADGRRFFLPSEIREEAPLRVTLGPLRPSASSLCGVGGRRTWVGPRLQAGRSGLSWSVSCSTWFPFLQTKPRSPEDFVELPFLADKAPCFSEGGFEVIGYNLRLLDTSGSFVGVRERGDAGANEVRAWLRSNAPARPRLRWVFSSYFVLFYILRRFLQ